MKALRLFLPLLILAGLAVFLWRGLSLNPREIPSVLVGKPAPQFSLKKLDEPSGTPVQTADLRGRVWLLNVWASWCSACVTEHPLLVDLARKRVIDIVGLDYKDTPGQAQKWLQQHGNPYSLILSDPDGRTGIDYGVYGVPESFLIDAQGVIRAKQIGPMTQEFIDQKIYPLLKAP